MFVSKVDEQLARLAKSTDKIYIFELFAAVSTVSALKNEVRGKKLILFVDSESACADLTGGAARFYTTAHCGPISS